MNRTRVLKRIGYGFASVVCGGLTAICGYALAFHKPASGVQTTNTTITTVINGVSHTTTTVNTVDFGFYMPFFFLAGLIFVGLLTASAILNFIYPDGI